ncbi:hypothetical protein [uncultured Treponema sp.]|uniref:hypothetical protein n=1 Tax=uncultured Treponema sp. TaxID=162155 RepID=UPI0025D4C1DA|nr:hypothetical protein [uncultured Treponema sp.]
MKNFAKISAVLVSLFFVFFALGCKDDSDDDEQSYLLEGGIISKTVYEKFRYYSSSQIDQCRAECLLYTKAGTYEKETVDEEDLTSELEGLTASQIQLIKESDALIQYFTFTENSDYVIWLYSQKE